MYHFRWFRMIKNTHTRIRDTVIRRRFIRHSCRYRSKLYLHTSRRGSWSERWREGNRITITLILFIISIHYHNIISIILLSSSFKALYTKHLLKFITNRYLFWYISCIICLRNIFIYSKSTLLNVRGFGVKQWLEL